MNREQTAQFREQLRAALCGAAAPLSTDEVARNAPWHVHRVASGCVSCHPEGQQTPWRVLECHGSWHMIERPRTGHDIYPHLRRLERDGALGSVRKDGDRKVYWVALAEPLIGPSPRVRDLDALGVAS